MIRSANEQDVIEMIVMGKAMHQESSYRDIEFSSAVFEHTLLTCIQEDEALVMVDEHEGELRGMFVGFYQHHFFSTKTVASDLLLYVKPELRSGRIGYNLAKAYTDWGESVADDVQVGITTGVNEKGTQRLYEALGYKQCGIILKR